MQATDLHKNTFKMYILSLLSAYTSSCRSIEIR